MTASYKHYSMPLSELLRGVVADSTLDTRIISGLSQDSRECKAGFLFFACAGAATHGNAHIGDALARGASVILMDGDAVPLEIRSLAQQYRAFAVSVPALNEKIGHIASTFYRYPSRELCVIGITGTNGKTSCSQFIAQCLHQGDVKAGVVGTLGNGIWHQLEPSLFTTPQAVAIQRTLAQIRDQGARYVAMEVSSHGLAQGRVNGVEFEIAVLTNLTRDHLDYHGDMESYAQAKQKLFRVAGLKAAVVNLDDEMGMRLASTMTPDIKQVAYAMQAELSHHQSYLCGVLQAMDQGGSTVKIKSSFGSGELHTQLMGRFNAHNLLAVLGVLMLLGMSLGEALARLQKVTPPAGRMERFGGERQKPLVIVDYAHTPDALAQVLQSLREHCRGELWVVFGAGGDRDRGKRPLMARAAQQFSDHVVVTNDNPRTESPAQIIDDIVAGFANAAAVKIEHDRKTAISYAIRAASGDDIVLVAGKGHEDYQIIGTTRHHFSDREVVSSMLGEAA